MLDATDFPEFPRFFRIAVEFLSNGFFQNSIDQGGLPRARNTGHGDELAQRKTNGQILKVVLLGTNHLDKPACTQAPFQRNRNLPLTREILTRDGFFIFGDLTWSPGSHHLTTKMPRTRPHINQIIRLPHGILIVFHHNQGIAQIPHLFETGNQAIIVPLVKSD